MHLLVLITAFTALLLMSRCSGDCDVQVRGVADALKPVIVNKHNALHAKVANGNEGSLPKASNMLEMIWDDTVAGKAQLWANKCKFAHDQPADRDTGNGYTGQNIAYESKKDENPDWEMIIQDFYDEVNKFDPNAIDKYYFQKNVGHFTQVIWANTYKVGCGYVRYLDGSNYYHLYGCNYLPGGNIVDKTIYKRGEPCSACGGCGSVSGLCVAGSSAMNSPEFIQYEEISSSNEYEENSNSGDYGKNNGVKQKSSIINLDGKLHKLF